HRFTAEVTNELGVARALTHEILVRVLPSTRPDRSTLDLTIDAEGRSPAMIVRIPAPPPHERSEPPQGGWAAAISENLLGASLAEQGRYAEAEPLLLESVAVLRSAQGVPSNRVRQAMERVITFYNAWGKSEKAAVWRLKLLDFDFPANPF